MAMALTKMSQDAFRVEEGTTPLRISANARTPSMIAAATDQVGGNSSSQTMAFRSFTC